MYNDWPFVVVIFLASGFLLSGGLFLMPSLGIMERKGNFFFFPFVLGSKKGKSVRNFSFAGARENREVRDNGISD